MDYYSLGQIMWQVFFVFFIQHVVKIDEDLPERRNQQQALAASRLVEVKNRFL